MNGTKLGYNYFPKKRLGGDKGRQMVKPSASYPGYALESGLFITILHLNHRTVTRFHG